jgi:L-seryl-tRNA(Ser) seleniumtransferase
LEVVLQEYLSEEKAVQNLPVLRMILKTVEEITADAKMLMRTLKRAELPAKIELQSCESQIGGGSLPLERLASVAVAIRPDNISVAELEERMRFLPVPIIPRVANDMVLMDVRTIDKKTFKLIADQLKDCMC